MRARCQTSSQNLPDCGVAARRGKVGEIFNLARQDGRRWRDGAEQKAHLSRESALPLAALARARLENLAYFACRLPRLSGYLHEMV